MKKILAFLLGCAAATGIFAQISTEFNFEFNSNLFNAISPTGDYAKKTMIDPISGDEVPNIGTENLDPIWLYHGIPGGRYVPGGDYSFFYTRRSPDDSTGLNYLNRLTDGRFRLYFNRDTSRSNKNISAMIGFGLFQALTASMDNPWFAKPVINWLLNNIRLDEFQIKIDQQVFTLWAGNLETPNMVDEYQDFSEWSSHLSVDGFGVNVASASNETLIFQPMLNRFLYRPHPGLITTYDETFSLAGRIKHLDYYLNIPVVFDIVTTLGYNPFTGSDEPSQVRVNGGVAVRGQGVADLLDFDLMYMAKGGDGNLDDTSGYKHDGSGVINHYLSLALGFPSLVPDFGFSFAYTAMFASYEDDESRTLDTNPYVLKKKGPVYNGIDLRMRYTGVPDFRFTLHNNITFANAGEPVFDIGLDEITTESRNIYDTDFLEPYHTQQWFALYNALAVRYTISSTIYAGLELAHRMSVTTELNNDEGRGDQLIDWGKSERIRNSFMASAFINFDFTQNAALQAGTTVIAENSKTTFSHYNGFEDFKGPKSWEGGGIGFGIPIRLAITF